ncbi:hypothetical protein TBLA_0B00770 [Henningerozyma blattae CBS 6284]|uniref:non-specific serine/threonine protein kinase n=1 Tax=Henningerozyma blattae (strain ATCC 34711 / CBS 6284 / DSM 70876 / NBRC 10599 / NRRL Y-10934 / UCD 77-7) TaxID=1071380 RepID=I2GXR8_HENB6|nr:hypothetical protein TBLA_0B00770 [Tetrapisispora blattae CBS 6284]CCH58920.1 hypothetical protein TBLA_0B00770 [Tetrapisispora blattae CBS 6284]
MYVNLGVYNYSNSNCNSNSIEYTPSIMQSVSSIEETPSTTSHSSIPRIFHFTYTPQSLTISPPIEYYQYLGGSSQFSSNSELSSSYPGNISNSENNSDLELPLSLQQQQPLHFLPPKGLKTHVKIQNKYYINHSIKVNEKIIENQITISKSHNIFKKNLPKNISIIDSTQWKSPPVTQVEDRFIIPQEKFRKKRSHSPTFVETSRRPSQIFNKLKISKLAPTNVTPDYKNFINLQNDSNDYSCTCDSPLKFKRRNSSSLKLIKSFKTIGNFFTNTNTNTITNSNTMEPPTLEDITIGDSQVDDSPTKNCQKCQKCQINTQRYFNKTLFHSLHRISQEKFDSNYISTDHKTSSGSSGVVNIMRHTKNNQLFAIKKFKPIFEKESIKGYWKKISTEYCIGTTLTHPNIIKTLEILLVDNKHFYQIMEYCQYDLFTIVSKMQMSYQEICCCFKQILKGVQYMHDTGMSHLDLKLDNCVMTATGVVKLIDFGTTTIFKYPFSNQIFQSTGIVGSDPYLPPEVFLFNRYDPRPVDVWSLGIIFFCMVVKRFPWKIPILVDESFRLFCLGRDSNSLSQIICQVPDPDEPSPSINSLKQYTSEYIATLLNEPPNIGPSRILRALPKESHSVIGSMIEIPPAYRATVTEILNSNWITSIQECTVTKDDQTIPGPFCDHTNLTRIKTTISNPQSSTRLIA